MFSVLKLNEMCAIMTGQRVRVCQQLREMGRGVGDLHYCATHSLGVLKPGNS